MVKIYALYLRQDDPKKNTILKLAKHGLVELIRDVHDLPRGLLILNPFVEQVVTPNDRDIVEKRGILVIDCSWSKSITTFKRLKCFLKGYHRRLPFLISVNPSHYGKPYMLTSAEAIAATLYITGFVNEAYRIMLVFKWGAEFFKINQERLNEYAIGNLDIERKYFQFSNEKTIELLKEFHDIE